MADFVALQNLGMYTWIRPLEMWTKPLEMFTLSCEGTRSVDSK